MRSGAGYAGGRGGAACMRVWRSGGGVPGIRLHIGSIVLRRTEAIAAGRNKKIKNKKISGGGVVLQRTESARELKSEDGLL